MEKGIEGRRMKGKGSGMRTGNGGEVGGKEE